MFILFFYSQHFSYLAAGLASEAVRVLSLRGDQASLTTALKVNYSMYSYRTPGGWGLY